MFIYHVYVCSAQILLHSESLEEHILFGFQCATYIHMIVAFYTLINILQLFI